MGRAGNRKAQWNIPRRADDGSKVEETVDVSFFKPMTELMVDMALLEVRVRRGGACTAACAAL